MDQAIQSLIQMLAKSKAEELFLYGTRYLSLLESGEHCGQESPFDDVLTLTYCLQDFASSQGLRLDPLHPSCGSYIPQSNMRWHCIIPPESPEGPIFKLRKQASEEISIDNFSCNKDSQLAIHKAFQRKDPILFCGPTAAGKTTLMTSLLNKYAQHERVIILEDIAEIPMRSKLWLRLLCQEPNREGHGELKIDQLFRDSLRIRPDRIVFGELRGNEIEVFFDALNSGHPGTLASIHAQNSAELIHRLNGIKCNKTIKAVFMDRGQPPIIKEISDVVI